MDKVDNLLNIGYNLAMARQPTHYLSIALSNIYKRCYHPNNPAYKHYGGRGIALYDGWIHNLEDFREWIFTNIGERPSPEYSLDRINNDGNYEPNNLRWATRSQQANNRRTPKNMRFVIYNGKKMNYSQCARELGYSRSYMWHIKKHRLGKQYGIKFLSS